MKTLTVREAKGQLARLIAEANEGSFIVLTDGGMQVALDPRPVANPEEDSPELEAELLKAVRAPHAPLVESELRGIADRVRGKSHPRRPR